MLFITSKKLFSFSRYSNFCISSSSIFFPVHQCFRGWSKINLKAYDVINCLNKNLITHFVWYLEKEKRCDIETLAIHRVLNKEHFLFWKNYAENVHQKLVADPFLILVNNLKQPLHSRNSFKNFERGLSKNLKKLTLLFLSNPVLFNGQDYEKQGPGTSGQSFFRLQNKFRKIHLLVMSYLTKSDDVI